MKRCLNCGVSKPPTEFHRHRLKPDGLQPWCAACMRADTGTKLERWRRELTRARDAGCMDCGETDHVVLQFHHRDPSTRKFGVTKQGTRTLTSLRREMAKCDVLCANCHLRRHASGTLDRGPTGIDEDAPPTATSDADSTSAGSTTSGPDGRPLGEQGKPGDPLWD